VSTQATTELNTTDVLNVYSDTLQRAHFISWAENLSVGFSLVLQIIVKLMVV
jgi:hypothetical protein